MGVHQLWQLLAPTCDKVPITSLKGKTIAVDLSSWIVESIQTFKRPSIPKPHLRNLFCRCVHLTRLGIKLVFICDGDAPSLKTTALQKRYGRAAAKFSRARSKNDESTGIRRSLLRVHTNECIELLGYLGIPHIQAVGEAEALCAFLNREKYVDAVLTEDSDAFLYGATVVMKGFNIGDPDISSYSMEKIGEVLKICREDMIGMGVLLGCDFYPGVPSIGKASCLKLCHKMKDNVTLLERLECWVSDEFDIGMCEFSQERSIVEKLSHAEKFSLEAIKDEFIRVKDKIDHFVHIWSCPDLKHLETFLDYNLDWPVGYTCEKSRCMITGWFISHMKSHPSNLKPLDLTPLRIVKSRKRQNNDYYEIEWQGSGYISERCEISRDSTFKTIEPATIILSVFPEIVDEFENLKKKRKPRKPKKVEKNPLTPTLELTDGIEDDDLNEPQFPIPSEMDICSKPLTPVESPFISTFSFSPHLQENIDSHLDFNDSSIIFVQETHTTPITSNKTHSKVSTLIEPNINEKLSTSLVLRDSDVEEIEKEETCEKLESINKDCSFELALPLYERLKMNSK